MSEACDHHHADAPPGAADVARAMQDADRRLTAEGERMTPSRLRVLELLLAAGEPVKAYDLIARFGEDGQPAKPPTVYRALEFLERKGLAHRIASISAYVACTSGAIDHAAAFLICDCCGATREIDPAVLDSIETAARGPGFTVQSVTIEAHGLCADCAA
jgi:Fur family zinc uptake transcriptional regulator